MPDEDASLPATERRKLYFEGFKHMTTLNTAAALFLLAVYREASWIPSIEVLFPMAGFGISLALSLAGMYGAAAKEDIEDRGHRVWLSGYSGLQWSLLTFFAGVLLALVIEAVNSAASLIGA